MSKKGKFETNFDRLFDEQKVPEPSTEKVFNKAAQNLGDEALEHVYNIMYDPNSADYVKLAAAKLLLSYARGTPIKKSETVISTPNIRPIILTDDPEEPFEQWNKTVSVAEQNIPQ